MTSQLGLRSLCSSAQLAGLSLFACCCLYLLSCNRFYTPTGLPQCPARAPADRPWVNFVAWIGVNIP